VETGPGGDRLRCLLDEGQGLGGGEFIASSPTGLVAMGAAQIAAFGQMPLEKEGFSFQGSGSRIQV
jgi:hypothetical protein